MRIAGLSALAKSDIIMYGQKYTLASLDSDEIAIFEDNFNKLLATADSQVRKIFEERVDTIVAGIMAIKEKLAGRKFRGLNPADMEIGMGFIRPEFVKTNITVPAAPSIPHDWLVAITGSGTWDRWLDSAAATGFVLSEDHGLIITHLTSQVAVPFARAVHFQIGRVNLIPEDVSDIILGDNENGVAVFPVPTKIVLPEDELLATVTGDFGGNEYLKLGGLVVGLGRLLKAEMPVW